MKLIDYIEDDCPDYALSYLVNGDASGIEDEDVQAADEWLTGCIDRLRRKYPEAVSIDLVIRDDDEGGFCHCPAFGLACNAVDCVVAVWVENGDPRPAFPLPWDEDEDEERGDG